MKKNPNLIHLLEAILLSGALGLLLFFMRRGSDLFFPLSVGFSLFALLFLLVLLYIDGDNPHRKGCKLIHYARSDLAFDGLLVQFLSAACFAVLHNLKDIPLTPVIIVYALISLLELALMFIPAPHDPLAPAANEGDCKTQKSLHYYAALLRNLIKKCEYESLSQVMEQTADLLTRIDPEFSVQLDALENDISSKCVKIENALLTHDTARLVLLERELSATVQLIENRCTTQKYCLTDKGYYHVDDKIAMAQIDLLLDKLGLEYEEDLPTLNSPFDSEFFYRKALRFATPEYAALLASYNQQIVDRAEAQKKEKAARHAKHTAFLRIFEQSAACLTIAAIAAVMLYWHTVLQPNGLILSDNEDGSLRLVGYNPFYGDELTVPAEVKGKPITAIGKEALMGSSLRSLTLPEGVTSIEYQALKNCEQLETIVLPKSLDQIGNYTFYNNDALSHIYYCGSREEWEAFKAQQKEGNLGNDYFWSVQPECDYSN